MPSARELMAAARAAGDPDFDPFEALAESTGAGATVEPYQYWSELRDEGPVHEGTAVPPPDESPLDAIFADRPIVATMSFQAVSEVFRNNALFSSATYATTFDLVWGPTIIGMDDPQHNRYRQLIQRAFSRREMDRWAQLARPIIRSYIQLLVATGRADLGRDLFQVFPVHVIARAIGLPDADLPRFFRLAVEMSNILGEPERAFTASMDLGAYLQEQLDERRRQAGPDLLSQLVVARLEPAEIEGDDGTESVSLSDDEIVSFIRLLLFAGAETTARSSATMFHLLLAHPDQLEMLVKDRSLIPAAVEETLRFEPPLAFGITRFATTDTEVAGCPVKAGTLVKQGIGAANRDPDRWDHPDVFDITRPQKGHLAFGNGSHLCLGMHVARVEMGIVCEEILDHFADLRTDPSAAPCPIGGRELRSPGGVPVLFTPEVSDGG